MPEPRAPRGRRQTQIPADDQGECFDGHTVLTALFSCQSFGKRVRFAPCQFHQSSGSQNVSQDSSGGIYKYFRWNIKLEFVKYTHEKAQFS